MTPTMLNQTSFDNQVREIIPMTTTGRAVEAEVMSRIYETVKTPFKYGIVLKGDDGASVDSPSIFRRGDSWFMIYVQFTDQRGYETLLAQSDDLLTWNKLGKLLEFSESGWDRCQAAGGLALQDYNWGGSAQLNTFDGKYWMSYIGGSLEGYETDPLAIGMAWSHQLDKAAAWERFTSNPVLSTLQNDVRDFEKVTLYRSHILWDEAETLGFPFVMYYNGKISSGYEKIGMAVSHDLLNWHRYGQEPVISNGEQEQNGISGDPQIVKISDVWVMFFFGAFWQPQAFDTFACSYDLVTWTQWRGPHLVDPSESWDHIYAHKPWLINHDGVTYHFYNAVGDQGRCIALATSSDSICSDH